MEHVLSATWRFDCVATMEPEVPCKVSDSISAKKQEGVFLTLGRKKKESKYIYIKQVVFPSSGMLWYINEALNSAV